MPDLDPPESVVCRPARPSDVDALTAVAHAAKGYWEYPEAWIEAWRPALTITAEDLARWTMVVAERDGEVAGFGAVDVRATPAVLEHLWVKPAYVRQGIGRMLFRRCAAGARAAGRAVLETDADPHALGFYCALGGEHVGEVRADVLGTLRTLPRVRFQLAQPGQSTEESNGGMDVFAS